MTVDDPYIIGAFGVAYTALTTTIAVLWRRDVARTAEMVAFLRAEIRKLSERVDELEADNETLRKQLPSGETAHAKINSCPVPKCPWREDPAKRETTRIQLRSSAA
jgi:hypothetical protein